eukprot:TRINITY_DN69567_c0_g1_i1.p1 TRINITY_DN69567_c0_g1~~TRINITY_DN69567_c0_g1_i1.p1  ORF type:complete len:314 (+),score=90.94 TRINITY_DN69567_c0_g1_i1:72-1013(+)
MAEQDDGAPAEAKKPSAEGIAVRKFAMSLAGKSVQPPCGDGDEGCMRLLWSAEELQLLGRAQENSRETIFKLSWSQIHAVWADIRTVKKTGFELELAVETTAYGRRDQPDFFFLSTALTASSRDLLGHLQDQHAACLKSGKAPKWSAGRLAASVYANGLPARTLRSIVNGSSLILEVLFSLCFFTQMEKIFLSRGEKLEYSVFLLLDNISELFSSMAAEVAEQLANPDPLALLALMAYLPQTTCLYIFNALRSSSDWILLLVILQHFLMLLFTVNQFASTFSAFFKSVASVKKAAGKAKEVVLKQKPEKQKDS